MSGVTRTFRLPKEVDDYITSKHLKVSELARLLLTQWVANEKAKEATVAPVFQMSISPKEDDSQKKCYYCNDTDTRLFESKSIGGTKRLCKTHCAMLLRLKVEGWNDAEYARIVQEKTPAESDMICCDCGSKATALGPEGYPYCDSCYQQKFGMTGQEE